jgi:hypothetical protein
VTRNAKRPGVAAIAATRAGVFRAKPTHVEDRLQHDLVEYFRVAVAPGPRAPLLFAVPNGEVRDRITAARLTGISGEQRLLLPDHQALQPFGLGVLPGVVDLILLLPGGRSVLIEVKRPADKARDRRRGRLSRMQSLFQARAIELEHRIVVVECVDEFAELLIASGITLRVRWWGPQVVRPGAPPRLPS